MRKSIGIRESYKFYKQEVKNPVKVDLYLQIASGFSKFITELILDGQTVKLPERLGTVCIVGTKVKPRIDENGNIIGLSPNWKDTLALWNRDEKAKAEKRMIYHFNEQTNGVRYRVHWSKKHVFIKNKNFYSFVPTKTNKTKIHELILEGKEYHTLEPKIKMYHGSNKRD